MKLISLSLPYSYLAGSIHSKRDQILTDIFGPARLFLPSQKQVLAGIEVSHFNEKAPADQVVSACRTVLESGFSVILHCHLPEQIAEGDIGNVYSWFPAVQQDVAKSGQAEILLNLHALSSDDATVSIMNLLDRTVDNLKLLTDKLEHTSVPTRIALEINREKGVQDPGTTYEHLLEICHQVDSPLLGLGWDIGHTYSNVLNGHIELNAPKEFVQRVIHTHIHDLGQDNETHWPLTVGTIPLVFYTGALDSVGYQGFYTLEIYPERFKDVLDPVENMLKSISILQNTTRVAT